MATAVSVFNDRGGAEFCHLLELELQSRMPKHGLGRIYANAAVVHGRRLTLLLNSIKNGKITIVMESREATDFKCSENNTQML